MLAHADGEEQFAFPTIEKVNPHNVELFTLDHRELDAMNEGLLKIELARTPLDAALATVVLRNHLRSDLDEEDAYLYPMLRAHATPLQQSRFLSWRHGSGVPPERMPAFIYCLYPVIDVVDSVKMADVWKQLMPEPALATLAPLIEKATGDRWGAMARQIGMA